MRMLRTVAFVLLSFPLLAGAESRLEWRLPEGAERASLRLELPDGELRVLDFPSNTDPVLEASDARRWPPGQYRYELWFVADGPQRSRPDEQAGGTTTAAVPHALLPQAGSFAIGPGQVLAHGGHGPLRDDAPRAKDELIADNAIVQGGLCAGLACVPGEDFSFVTLRLKEDNTRLHFADTSNAAGFAGNQWMLVANESGSGGANLFAIEDHTAGRRPLVITAGARNNAVSVGSNGWVGLGTALPQRTLHMVEPDTPTLRMEQTSAGGYMAQTWDVAGNEANFFIRDTTNGSVLPLRIRPGAPTSSLDIAASGDVGLGTPNPSAPLHLRRGAREVLLLVEAPLQDAAAAPAAAPDPNTRLRLDGNGNLYVGGTVAQLSSREVKHEIAEVDGEALLQRLAALPIATWHYSGANAADRHLGPYAEDFHAAFGLGASPTQLAPSDVAGVALAAAQALQQEVANRDRRIAELEGRLARLEALLEPLSAAR